MQWLRTSYPILLCVAMWMVAAIAVADEGALEEGAVQWYQVELLVFANENSSAEVKGGELFYAHTLSYPLRLVRLLVAPIVAPDDTALRNLRSHQAEDYWDDGALAPPATNIAELNARDASLQWWEDGLADEETTHSTPERTAGASPRTSDTGGNNVSDLPEDSSATLPYQVLPPDQWNLATAHNNLRQDHNGYRILFHEAWLQPVYSREEAQSVLIEGGQVVAQLQRELSGYLTLSASRYLHLDVDLWLQDEERLRRGHQKKARVLTLVPVLPGTLSLETDAGLDSDDNDALSRVLRQLHATDTPARPLLRMRQHRKMTAQSLHFLDHPAFGVLISVAPAPTNPDQ